MSRSCPGSCLGTPSPVVYGEGSGVGVSICQSPSLPHRWDSDTREPQLVWAGNSGVTLSPGLTQWPCKPICHLTAAGHGVSSGICASQSGVEVSFFLSLVSVFLLFYFLGDMPEKAHVEWEAGRFRILGSLPCPICDSGNQTVFWSCQWRDVLKSLTACSKSPQTQRSRDPQPLSFIWEPAGFEFSFAFFVL